LDAKHYEEKRKKKNNFLYQGKLRKNYRRDFNGAGLSGAQREASEKGGRRKMQQGPGGEKKVRRLGIGTLLRSTAVAVFRTYTTQALEEQKTPRLGFSIKSN